MAGRFFWAGIALALVPFVVPPSAGAHAAYKDSQPGDEETVHEAPDEVRVEFTEPPTDTSYLEIYNECGDQVDSGDTQVIGYELVIGLDGDSKGIYTVAFVVQSALDSHVTEGEFTFTAHAGSSCGPAPQGDDDEPQPDPEESPPADHSDHDDENETGEATPTPSSDDSPGDDVGGSPPADTNVAGDPASSGPAGPSSPGTKPSSGDKRAGGGKAPDESRSDAEEDDETLVADAGDTAGDDEGAGAIAAPAASTRPGGLEPYLLLVVFALLVLAVPGAWLIRSLVDSPDDRAGAPLGSMWAKPPL